MTRARWIVAALLSAAALVSALAACGDDDEPSTETTATETTGSTNGSAEDVVVETNGDFKPVEIYREVSPGVVTVISVLGEEVDPLGGGAGQGSGFVVSEDGEIVTNAHVVSTGGAASGGGPIREASDVFVQFADRNQVAAEVVGIDPDADVALLKVDPEGLDLVPLQLSDGSGIHVGEPVAAIGSPFGEQQSLSIGVISATDRTIPSLTDFSIAGAIQTDASINPGNSGGPLLEEDAEVIGINQQIETQSGSSAGVGFAVPIDAVRYSLDQLRANGKVEYAYIGVTTQSLYPQLADELGLEVDAGALVAEVQNGSPAEEAGIKGGDEEIMFQARQLTKGGDVIVSIDGKPVESSDDVADLIADKKPGDTVSFEIVRGGQRRKLDVTLEARPAGTSG